MADSGRKGAERARPYPPDQERLFLRPYTAGQMPQEPLAAARRSVKRFQ